MSDQPEKPKGKRIKLGLFLPWDEKTGRLFNEEKFRKQGAEEPPPETQADDKILKFPDEGQKKDEE